MQYECWAYPAAVDTSGVSFGVFYPTDPIAAEPVVMWSARSLAGDMTALLDVSTKAG